VSLQEPYYLRDFRGQVVRLYPFQYNPVTATLRVYHEVTIEIVPSDPSTLGCMVQYPQRVSSDFLMVYERHFINYNPTRYTPVPEQGNMLVITYDDFYDEMVPFVQWKNLKGTPTEMVNVSGIGNANAIKTYISTYYATNNLTFVLLVGDAAQVPTAPGGSASDPGYSFIVGSDYYSDIYVGRFSAENTAQLQTQIDRSIDYEMNPQAGADWYKKGVGVASSQGPGDDNEMDYEHIRNIRALLLNFTYSFVDELYDGSQGGGDAPGNPTPTMVATAVNEGRSIINYCGHGWMQGWGSSGFDNSDVNALTNDNMLPFIVSVACNNGEFDSGTCFGEAWLRATNNGQPTGGIGAFMSMISQSWDPPMQAQDEFNDILTQKYPDNRKTTYGALCFCGCMSMNDEYGSAGYYEADAWTVFGDPSLQVRTDTPSEMTVNHGVFIEYGATSFELDVPGVPDALCAISFNYKTLGYGLTDATGHAVIEFFEPLAADDSVDFVVTALNKIPYMAVLSVGEPNQPPAVPEKPTGPAEGKPGVSYMYRTSTTDAEGDPIFYMWDWGDGTFSEWVGPFASGQTATTTHTWEEQGGYAVRVKASDGRGETDWSEPLDVTMPTSTLWFILQQHFPRLAHFLTLLQQLLQ
ncbi:MAG: PKD domain-containing protein, partial [Candidatus Thermoplasmatota archaeon]|nr:PKD domain-containing protein [Candidatus Thermoplasmatota archaeon]